MVAEQRGVGGRRQPRSRSAERVRGVLVAAELLVGEAQVDEEHAVVARDPPASSAGAGRARIASSCAAARREVAARLRDRDLQVGALQVVRVGGEQLVGERACGLVEPAQVAQRAAP